MKTKKAAQNDIPDYVISSISSINQYLKFKIRKQKKKNLSKI